ASARKERKEGVAMFDKSRVWLAVMVCSAAGAAGIFCLTSATAVAEPMPIPPPTPVTVTQTVTVAPMAGAPAMAPAAVAPIAAVPTASAVPPMALAPGAAPTVTQPGVAGYQSVPASAPTMTPATSGTLRDYFTSKHVKMEPRRSQGFTALNITLPVPPAWTAVPDPNVPDAFAVFANRTSPDLYTPNAQLVVYKLVGDFDPKEAITHGFIDSQSLPAWQTTDASLADFYGFPSSKIEGTYRQNDMPLNTSRRHVIATVGPDRYLVSLSVTSMAHVQGAPSSADATDAIVNGFRVANPAAPAVPSAPAAPTVPSAPFTPVAPAAPARVS